MSYRNDHDAALARVDALQAEVAQLKRDAAKAPRPPVRRGALRWLGAGIGIATLAGIFTGAFVLGSSAEAESQTSEAVAQLDTRMHRARLDLCVEAIAQTPQRVAPDSVSPGDLRAFEAMAGSCLTTLRAVRGEGLWSPAEIEALDAWITAEETLGNTVSMMSIYYSDQPPRDNYASSAQLSREYGRARSQRDDAVAHWRETR